MRPGACRETLDPSKDKNMTPVPALHMPELPGLWPSLAAAGLPAAGARVEKELIGNTFIYRVWGSMLLLFLLVSRLDL